jgi:hypothetical protein
MSISRECVYDHGSRIRTRVIWKCFVVHKERKEEEVLGVEDINSSLGTCVRE